MCGIVGYVGNNALPVLIKGLNSLEYRGYDSAGVAYLKDGIINTFKEVGKVKSLEDKLNMNDISTLGIAHTRWATHGGVNQINSHPHTVGKITLVHNGIIENYASIKEELIELGYNFISETDTEVLAAIVDYFYKQEKDMIKVLPLIKSKVTGSYASVIICEDDLDCIYAIKKDSPLIIGLGDNENYVASDVPAILSYTSKYLLLLDYEYAKITSENVVVYDTNNEIVSKEIKVFSGSVSDIDKKGYEHFMLKEISEEPDVIRNTVSEYLDHGLGSLIMNFPDFDNYERIDIVACGSAMHAGMIGKVLIEEYANVLVNVEVASEYRYKRLFLNDKVLVIAISQSGETADTLAAVKIAKEKGAFTLGIINVVESSIAREVDTVLYTKAGSEIAVATTKAYLSQMAMLMLIAIKIAVVNGNMDMSIAENLLDDLRKMPQKISKLINKVDEYREIAKAIYENQDIFYIGRGIDYAISMEGSLKLKEISYTNCQAYQAGELKHGTISLVEDGTPVIAVITDERIADKTISNLKEVSARGAKIILITTEELYNETDYIDYCIVIPTIDKMLQSLLTIVPLQLIAYETAKLRGCDIDKPRNLAKSVTVE